MKSSNTINILYQAFFFFAIINISAKSLKLIENYKDLIDTNKTVQSYWENPEYLKESIESLKTDVKYFRKYVRKLNRSIDSLKQILANSDNQIVISYIAEPNDRHRKLYGFNRRNGEVIALPIYRWVEDFKNGNAIVYSAKGMKAGLLDSTGKIILPAKYEFIGIDIGDGIRQVYDGKYWYYYYNNGEKIFENKFLAASRFINSKALVLNDAKELVFINKSGVELGKANFSASLPDSLATYSQETLASILLPSDDDEKYHSLYNYIESKLVVDNSERYFLNLSGHFGEPFSEVYQKLRNGIIEKGKGSIQGFPTKIIVPGISVELAQKFINKVFNSSGFITVKKVGENVVITETND